MSGQPVRLGPFTGGINTLSDPTAIDDTELVDCVNMEVDLDGSLLSRPPVVATAGNGGWSDRILNLCFAVFSGTTYLIGSNASGVWYSTNKGSTWTLITNTIICHSAIQYADKVFLLAISSETDPSGTWTPGGGFVADATMPKGQKIVAHKEYLFVCRGNASTNASTVYWSQVKALSWPALNNADINLGDGQYVVDLHVYNDNLMVFKNDSTYAFSFDSNPSKATVRKISSTIGATTRRCVVPYENALYVYHEGNVYEMINYDFNRLNSKVPFLYDPTKPSPYSEEVFLCLFGDRVVVRYYNRIYVFGLRTRTWTRWSSTLYFGPLLPEPVDVTQGTQITYIGGSCILADEQVYTIKDGFNSSDTESMVCSVTTKNYDVGASLKFKRLFWWGADVSMNGNIVGKVTPIVQFFTVQWSQLSTYQWGQLNTWDYPTITPLTIETSITSTTGTTRKFVKFLKSIRFRQVNFEMDLACSGATTDSPVRIFNMTAILDTKETVVQQVS